MSFDLYFLERPTQGDWTDAMEVLEVNAESDRLLSIADLATWQQLVEQVRDLLPDAETFEGDGHRELRTSTGPFRR